jgi:colicin import membrane protein
MSDDPAKAAADKAEADRAAAVRAEAQRQQSAAAVAQRAAAPPVAPQPSAAPAAPAGRASTDAAAASGPSHGATPPVNAPNPPTPPPFVSGAQVILTGEAKAAARGDMHGSIEHNTAERDAAIASGHVDPDTSPEAVADTLAASVGSTPTTLDPKAAADLKTAQQKEIADRAKAAGAALPRR